MDHKVFGAEEIVWGKNICIWHGIFASSSGFFVTFALSRPCLGGDARVYPAAPGDEHDGGEHRQIHSDQSRETAQGQVWWAARQAAFVSSPYKKFCILSAKYDFFFGSEIRPRNDHVFFFICFPCQYYFSITNVFNLVHL